MLATMGVITVFGFFFASDKGLLINPKSSDFTRFLQKLFSVYPGQMGSFIWLRFQFFSRIHPFVVFSGGGVIYRAPTSEDPQKAKKKNGATSTVSSKNTPSRLNSAAVAATGSTISATETPVNRGTNRLITCFLCCPSIRLQHFCFITGLFCVSCFFSFGLVILRSCFVLGTVTFRLFFPAQTEDLGCLSVVIWAPGVPMTCLFFCVARVDKERDTMLFYEFVPLDWT